MKESTENTPKSSPSAKPKPSPSSGRRGSTPPKNAFLIIVNNRNQILLQCRNPHSKYGGGQLGLVGGGINHNETPLNAAVRECKEECRLTISATQIERVCTHLNRASIFIVQHTTPVNNPYEGIDGPQDKSKNEINLHWGHEGHKWCPFELKANKVHIRHTYGKRIWHHTQRALNVAYNNLRKFYITNLSSHSASATPNTAPQTTTLPFTVQVVPYGVLGKQLVSKSGQPRQEQDHRTPPDHTTAFVDPAGLPYIRELGPQGAGEASGAIYKFLGIQQHKNFESDVRNAILVPGDAKYTSYNNSTHHVIHCVGPDFRTGKYVTQQTYNSHPHLYKEYKIVEPELRKAYRNIFEEFSKTPTSVTHLRLLPISGGVFSGGFKAQMPQLTFDVLREVLEGIHTLNQPPVKARLRNYTIEMCIYEKKHLEAYVTAFRN